MMSICRLLCLVSSFVFGAAKHHEAKDEAVVIVVDPIWDDVASYAEHVPLLGKFKIVKVMTRLGKSHAFSAGHVDIYRKFTYQSETADPDGATTEICPQLKKLGIPIAAVIPTSDGTTVLTDQLAACVGARGSPSTGPLALARRDKWAMGESVRKAGLRSVKEKIVTSWTQAEAFLKTLEPPLSPQSPCIFKVLTGAGGEGVIKVYDMVEAKAQFMAIQNSHSQFGGVYTKVLIQEFLKGREYAIDSVSRDGVHKVVAVWFEDFREANGVFDQYFGFKLLDPADAFTKIIIDYGTKVLDATGLRDGAANTEVKWLELEQKACLVEINARWAGIGWKDGLAVEQAAVGTNQVAAAFDAYLDQDAFDKMPSVLPLKQHGAVVFTVNTQRGILIGIPGLYVAMHSPSFLSSDLEYATMGKVLPLTTPNAIPINIALVHPVEAVVTADYNRLIDLEYADQFFDIMQLKRMPHQDAPFPSTNLAGLMVEQRPLMLLAAVGGLLATGVMVMLVMRRKATDDTEYFLATDC